MKASIKAEDLTITLKLSVSELREVKEGLGSISIDSSKAAGMTNEQAVEVSNLFYALHDAMQEANVND